MGRRLWDVLGEAGAPLGVIPIGSLVSGTTARLETGGRSRALDFQGGYDLVEAGLIDETSGEPGGAVKATDFIGRAALLEQLGRPAAARLCTLRVDDHSSPGGQRRFMVGNEPVVTSEGAPLVDARGRRSYVTSAGSAPSLGWHLLNAYLPAEQAAVGAPLAVECFGDRYPVTVVSVGPVPLVPSTLERTSP
jgi:glycine cleavage system aminomethyltransferase T